MKQKNGRVVAKCMCKIGIGKDNKCAQQDSGKENHLATCFISSIIPFDSLSLARSTLSLSLLYFTSHQLPPRVNLFAHNPNSAKV